MKHLNFIGNVKNTSDYEILYGQLNGEWEVK
jgi:hypothetical protein